MRWVRKEKTLSDAKAELNNITERRGKVVQNLKISLDDYNNKKEEAQEAVQGVGRWIWKNSSAS